MENQDEKKAPQIRYQIHNCHTHIFTLDYIPKYYLSKFFPTQWAKRKWVAHLGNFLFKKYWNRYAAFFYSALKDSQMDVLKELRGYYPRNTKFCVLSVDFDFMNAGPPKFNFEQQINHLAKVASEINMAEKEELVLPFIGIDPRRDNLLDLVKRYVEDKGFRGMKLYPALGFFPNDERLYPVYEYAEKYELPITTHCIPKNKNHFRFKPTEEMINQAKLLEDFDPKDIRKKYDFARYLNDPHWYGVLLKDFPNLKVNLAHFGGNKEWDKYLDNPNEEFSKNWNWYTKIRELLKKHPNVYSDISFTVFDRDLYPLLKNLVNSEYKSTTIFSPKNKVLFGTDFYMLQKDYKERRFGLDLRGYLTDEEYWQIAEINPRNFLANKLKK